MNENKDIFTGRRRTEQLFKKIKAIATYIAQRDGIDIKEATEQYEQTEHYQKLMRPDTDLLDKTEVEVVADYMLSEEAKLCKEEERSMIHSYVFPSHVDDTMSEEIEPKVCEKEDIEQQVFANYHCMYDDVDYAPMIKKTVAEVAKMISLQKGISYEEAYRAYVNSNSFKVIEDINSHSLVKPTSELALDFLDELDKKDSIAISPKRK